MEKLINTISTTQYWTNKRSKLVWSVQQSENDIIIFRNNMTKTISIDNLLKNYRCDMLELHELLLTVSPNLKK
mgnify:CR=1 FL=1